MRFEGDDYDRRVRRFDGAQFRNRDLKVGEHFEQKGFECFIGAIDLVHQQHRRAGGIRFESLEERPFDQKAFGEHVVLEPFAVTLAFRFGGADRDHLRGVIPLIDRRGDVEALVTLQADQATAQRGGQDLGDLGLADAGLAFQKNRPAHLQRKIEDGA